MNWVILVVAGVFEMGWAIGLKYTDGFTRIWPTIGTVCAMIISLALLGFALKSLPVGTAYAVSNLQRKKRRKRGTDSFF